MPKFPGFKLADFLPERDLKAIIFDAPTYSNIQLNKVQKLLHHLPHNLNINDPGKKAFGNIVGNGENTDYAAFYPLHTIFFTV